MKTLASLLIASALGLGACLPATTQAAIPGEEVLIAQRGWDDDEDESEYREPIDKSTIKDRSGKNTWIPISVNENKVATAWIRTTTYEPLNENSFRFQAKGTLKNGAQVEGRIDMNCKNKDYYFRPNGIFAQNAPWNVIPEGSGVEVVAKLYCKKTAAKEDWGYSPETAFLWDAPIPTTPADMASGEWITTYDKPDGQAYYNDGVEKIGNVVTYAFYWRTTKGDMSAKNKDEARYAWFRASCNRNIGSMYTQLDQSVPGEWLPPTPGSPGGAMMIVRKKFCK